MVSIWKNDSIVDCLTEDYENHLKSYGENNLNDLYKALFASLEKSSCYADALHSVIYAWEQLTQFPIVDVQTQVAIYVECLARATRHVTLAGEWMVEDKLKKDRLELILKKLISIGAGRKETVEGVANLAANPWSSPTVTNLLMGKSELQQQVLQLASTEGVECVLLRLELLVESGLDSPAYKFASAVATSLLADHIVFKSYVSSCKSGTLERIVDIFLALAVATKHESKLYKVLRLLGIEDVNKIYVPHFIGFLEELEKNIDKGAAVRQYNQTEKFEDGGAKKQENQDENKGIRSEDKNSKRFGRCDRLFTRVVCERMLEVFYQWSVAGLSLKECPDDLQNEILSRWLEFNFKKSGKTFKVLQDVDSLVKTANQTSFLYNIAYKLWKQLSPNGKDVEEVCLKMFVKGLTHDLNAQEAAKKDKAAKAAIEARMARAFVLMADVVEDRLALCRECVLTAFSIKPSQNLFDRLKLLAKESGFDNLTEHVENLDIKEESTEEGFSGIHCRVAFSQKGDASKIKRRFNGRNFSKAYPSATGGKLEPGTKETSGIKHEILNDKMEEESEDRTFKEKDLEDLNKCCDSMLDSTKFSRVRTKLRSNMSKDKKKFRNLEGILAIQGELITQASNYDPLDEPCKSLRHDNLNLSKQLTDDLLIVLSAPRWHLLSWVMEWPELEKVSAKLLEDPTLREPKEDLKFLNIDYTQFDEWSSDEEITIYTGIERGYEQWLTLGSDEDSFEERGMSPGNEDELVFNTTHTVVRPDFKNPDCFLVPEDYLPNKVGKGDGTSMETSDKENEIKFETGASIVTANSIDNAEKDLEPEKSKSELNDMPKYETEVSSVDDAMDVGLALCNSSRVGSMRNWSSERLLGRMLLARVVPGLEGTAVPPPDVTQIFMVQITTAGGPVTTGKPTQRHLVVVGSNSSQSIVTTSGQTFLLRPGPSGITVAATARSITATPTNSVARHQTATPTTIRLTAPSLSTTIRPSLSPIIMSPSSSPLRGTAPNKKIQYICKQGNQTFVVDYPMSAAVIEKMRVGGGGLQLRLPVGALRPVSLPETITTQSAADANLPKFQFAFGQSPTPSPAPEDKAKSVPASPSSSCSSVTVPEHGREDEGLAGRLGSLLESAGIASSSSTTTGDASVPSVRSSPSVPVSLSSATQVKQLPSQAVLVSAGLTNVQETPKKVEQEVCVKQEVGATVITSSASQGPADLIRQLNLARAQGLVVLQQWGDKQVLVHKATGRWIMRQGSRLVTVPPQALGITPSQSDHPGPPSTPPSPAISSRTMEQLAEFDSILESKFKTCESPGPGESPPSPSPLSASNLSPLKSVVVVAAPSGPGGSPTRQIIQLPTTPIKKEALMSPDKATAALLNKTMPPKLSPTKVHTCPATFPKPPPKPQEDPETLKRIQAILDDYNDQIRNSPDLHNRPAPRRRTNGTGNPDSPTAGSEFSDSPPGPSSGSTSPNNMKRKKPGMSPGKQVNSGEDALSLAVAEIKESGTITLAQPTGLEPGQVTSVRLVPKPVIPTSPGSGTTSPRQIRQIMVPNALAASLGGQRLMVVSSGDGRRMVAVRPVLVTTSPGSSVIQHVVTSSSITRPIGLPPLPVSISLPTSPVPVSTVSSLLKLESPSLDNRSSPLVQSGRPLDRPGSPGLGIPMEMTPGQIMEAEMSATMMENPTSPFHNPHSVGLSPPCSEEQVPNCLPENVFSGEGMGYTLDASHEEVITTTQDHHNGFPVDRIILPNTPSSGSVCDEARAEQSSYLSDASIDLPSDASDLHDLHEYSDAPKNLHNYHSVKLDNDSTAERQNNEDEVNPPQSSNHVSSNLEMPSSGLSTSDVIFDRMNDHNNVDFSKTSSHNNVGFTKISDHNNVVFTKTSEHSNVVFAQTSDHSNVIFTKTSDHNVIFAKTSDHNSVVFAKTSDHSNVVFAKTSDHNNVVFTKRERRCSARGQKQDSEVTSTELMDALSSSMLTTSTRRRSGRCDDIVTPENKKLKKNNSTEDLDLSTRHSPRNKSSKIHEKYEKTEVDKLLTVTNSLSSTKRQNSPSKPTMSLSEGGVSTRKQKRK